MSLRNECLSGFYNHPDLEPSKELTAVHHHGVLILVQGLSKVMIITSVTEKTCLGNPLVVLLMRKKRVRNGSLSNLESIFHWRTLALACQKTKWKL